MIILVVCTAALLGGTPSFAATSARIQVIATVLPFVSFNASQHVATYQVRSEDLRRGYVDLPNSLTVTLRTNVGSGVPVIIDNWGSGRVLVRESGTGTFADGTFVVNTAGYRAGAVISKNFDSRVVLQPDAREGVYPLTISLMPTI